MTCRHSNASRVSRRRCALAAAALVASALVPSRDSYALTFNLTPASGISPQAITGFQMAAQRWSSLLSDNVTVNLNIGFSSLGAGILGQASSVNTTFSYIDTRSALQSHRT